MEVVEGSKVAEVTNVEGQLPPLASLRCTLCSNFFKEPLTLQCLHSFCKSCLLKYNGASEDELEKFLVLSSQDLEEEESSSSSSSSSDDEDEDGNESEAEEKEGDEVKVGKNAENISGVGNSAGDKRKKGDGNKKKSKKKKKHKPKQMKCPTCTEVLHLPKPEEPTEPFSNARLERIINLVNETPILCQNCHEAESELKCGKCEAYCCKPCWDVTHQAPIFQTHEKIPLRHDAMIALPKCEQHPLNDLEFFVTDQECGACQTCLLKGEFVGRPYALVTNVRTERQQEIESGVNEVLEERERIMSGKADVTETIAQLDINIESQQDAVKKNFAEIRKALDEREQVTLSQLKQLHDAKKSVLDDQLQRIDTTVNKIDDSVNSVQLVLKYSNPLEVVYSVYVLQDYIQQVSNFESTAPKVCAECDEAGTTCHHPAVDEELPVLLSSKVSQIVHGYGSVPESSFVLKIATGEINANELTPSANESQKELLNHVAQAAKSNEEDYGCCIQ